VKALQFALSSLLTLRVVTLIKSSHTMSCWQTSPRALFTSKRRAFCCAILSEISLMSFLCLSSSSVASSMRCSMLSCFCSSLWHCFSALKWLSHAARNSSSSEQYPDDAMIGKVGVLVECESAAVPVRAIVRFDKREPLVELLIVYPLSRDQILIPVTKLNRRQYALAQIRSSLPGEVPQTRALMHVAPVTNANGVCA
jgi:hypothetical protein